MMPYTNTNRIDELISFYSNGTEFEEKNRMCNYRALGAAVVLQAIQDYVSTVRWMNNASNFHSSTYWDKKKNIIERFFYSDWFSILTDVDPKYLLDKINKEIELENSGA